MKTNMKLVQRKYDLTIDIAGRPGALVEVIVGQDKTIHVVPVKWGMDVEEAIIFFAELSKQLNIFKAELEK